MKNFKYIYFIFFLLKAVSASLMPTLQGEKDTLNPSTADLKIHMGITERFKQDWKGLTADFIDEPRRSQVNLPNFADQESQNIRGQALNFLINLRRYLLKKENLTLPELPSLPDSNAPLRADDLLEWLRIRQEYLAAKKVFDGHLMVTVQSHDQIRRLLSWLDLSRIPHGEDAIYQGCSDEVLRRTLRLSTVLDSMKESEVQAHKACFDSAQSCSAHKCLWIHLVQNHKITSRIAKGHAQKMMVRTAHYSAPPTPPMTGHIHVFNEVLVYRTKLLESVCKSLESYAQLKNRRYGKISASPLIYETTQVTAQSHILWGNKRVKIDDLTLEQLELLRFKFNWKTSREVILKDLVSNNKASNKFKTPKRALVIHPLLARMRVLVEQKKVLKQRINDLNQHILPLSATLESLDCSLEEPKRDEHRKRLKRLKVLLKGPDLCALGNLGNASCGNHCLIPNLDAFWTREHLAEYESMLNREVYFLNAALGVKLDILRPDNTYAKNLLTDELGRFYAAHLKFFKNLGYPVALEDDFPIFLDASYSLVHPNGSESSFTGAVSDVPEADWQSLSTLAHDNRRFLEVMNYAMTGSKQLGYKPRPNMAALAPLTPRNLEECKSLLKGFLTRLQETRGQLLDLLFKARSIENRREFFNKSKLRNPYFGRIQGIGFTYLFDLGLLPDHLNRDLIGLTQYLNFVRRYCVVTNYALQAIGADAVLSDEFKTHLSIQGVSSQNLTSATVAQNLVGNLTRAMEHNKLALEGPRKADLAVNKSGQILGPIKVVQKVSSINTPKADVEKKFGALEQELQGRITAARNSNDLSAVGLMQGPLDALTNLRKHIQDEVQDNWENKTASNLDVQNASTSQTSQSASAGSSSTSSAEGGSGNAMTQSTTSSTTSEAPKDAIQIISNQEKPVSRVKSSKGSNYAPFAKKRGPKNKNGQQQKEILRKLEPKDNKKKPNLTTAGIRHQMRDPLVRSRRDKEQEWEQEARDGDWQEVRPRFKKNQRNNTRFESRAFPNSSELKQLNSVEAPKGAIQAAPEINSEASGLNPDLAHLFRESAQRSISWADLSDDDKDDSRRGTKVEEVTVAVEQFPVSSSSSSETNTNDVKESRGSVIGDLKQQRDNMTQGVVDPESAIVLSTQTSQGGATAQILAQSTPEISPQDSSEACVQDLCTYPNNIPIASPNLGLEFSHPAAHSENLPTHPALRVELIRSRVREGIASQRAHEASNENFLLRQQLVLLNEALRKSDQDLQRSRAAEVRLGVEKLMLEKTLIELKMHEHLQDLLDPEIRQSSLELNDSRD